MKLIKEINFRLTTGAFDCYDRIRPYAIFDLFQEIAGIHAEEMNIGFQKLLSKDIIWVLARNKYTIEHQIKVSSVVTVKTWPHPYGHFDCVRDYEIYDESGNLCVRGSSKWCLVNINSMKIVPMTNANVEGEHYEKNTYDEHFSKIEFDQKSKCEIVGKHIVQMSDLDHNGHMNNAKYAELLCNVLELNEAQKIISVEMNYLKQLFLHDIITLKMIKKDHETILIGEKDETCCFVCRCQWQQ